jgi:hypothetical protein
MSRMRAFYGAYAGENENLPQLVAEIPRATTCFLELVSEPLRQKLPINETVGKRYSTQIAKRF